MYIGNDIVDINLALENFKKKKVRSHQYTLSPSERDKFKTFIEKDIHFWVLWSMKEALYKSYVKAGLRTRFEPAKLELLAIVQKSPHQFIAYASDGQRKYLVNTSLYLGVVHSISYEEKVKEQNILYRHKAIVNDDYATQYQKVRQLAMTLLPCRGEKEWTIKKDVYHVPQLLLDDKQSPHELSLSHHGNYVAAAIHLKDY